MYNPHNISVLAYANGFTFWHYVTTDSGIEVLSEGYFDKSYDMLRKNDRIIVVASEEAEESENFDIYVVSIKDGVVKVKMTKALAVLG